MSKQIIEKWLDKLANSGTGPHLTKLLKELASSDELHDKDKLKAALAAIEERCDQDQDIEG